jgi:hypothetical protein
MAASAGRVPDADRPSNPVAQTPASPAGPPQANLATTAQTPTNRGQARRKSGVRSTETTSPKPEKKETSRMAIDISKLQDITGFIGGCVVDSDSGMMLASLGGGNGFDLEVAAAANTEVVKAKLRAMQALGLADSIEDILISLGTQYHLIRPMAKNPAVFIYVAVDRKTANLALARTQVKAVEGALKIS